MLLLLLALAHAEPGDVFLDDVRIADALGARGPTDVLIRDGAIAAIGDLEPGDATVLPVQGATVVPGLIDTHVHISMAPGAAWRDPPADPDAVRAHHLRAYLASGVTTILDPAILPEDARAIRALEARGASPRIALLGPAFSPEGGYVAAVIPEFPGVSDPAGAEALFATFDGLDPVGVKVLMEDGPLGSIWPLHSQEVREAIIAGATARRLDVYVHAMSPPMLREALGMEPHALVHAPQHGPGRRALRELEAQRPFIAPTLAIAGSALLPRELERLDAPHVVRTVRPEEIATARDPEVERAYQHAVIDVLAPKMPRFLRGAAISVATREGSLRKRLRRAQKAVMRVYEAGVPLVVGSDAGNWPILPYLLHGPSTHLELELMVDAGLSPEAVLTAATATPARMLHLDDRIGTVEVGKEADLVVVSGDPLADVGVLRDPLYTIRAGVARTPDEWMSLTP